MDLRYFRLGLFFASIAVLFWGILPIALKLSVSFIDPVTLTWFRFFVALVISLFVQYFSGKLAEFTQLNRKDWCILSMTAIFSICNYVSIVYALEYLSPGEAQLNFQTAPFFLALGGVMLFKEKLKPIQIACFVTLALGMIMFFYQHLDFSKDNNTSILFGILIVQFSALSWSCFALMQKFMSKKLSPNNTLLFIYGFGIFALLPFTSMYSFTAMTLTDWYIAIFCAFNTLIAYGCFAQAMRYWPASQVGSMVALTPIFSFLATWGVVEMAWWPDVFQSDELDIIALLGIALVVSSVLAMQLLVRFFSARLSSVPISES
ncbi:DMT family transporter [Shewanella surugensis]|uniref:DMT family transporter n=1 Tax=Shewanella surugensis TaxID=212020 RepID=A0ABT0LAY7_9GAMM|nr:DMT family transporter [Shewanella surugensis]MCL1124856.1 DMT family transporter [Shewanella surugensis]